MTSFGNAGPNREVVAAHFNPTEPHGPRPYHRPDCTYVNDLRAVGAYWKHYPRAASAIADGHVSACRRCAP